MLIVTAGTGRVQQWGQPIEEIRVGDVVRIPPNAKHRHGAAPATSMAHIAVVEQLPTGNTTNRMEKVSLEQYHTACRRTIDRRRATRDRSLVTVSALIVMNRPDQLRSHLLRARQNGVTEQELSEAMTHLAFYAGWRSALTAVTAAREVFEKK
ncbi:MAG TPA: carboxymuconolactone decarboxylase family protein [Thermoanaerobaculia bacterium]|nr:carboxymuconolactone decarboxylase family protein [Thermoanaerobaculia bacterium]